MGDESSQFGVLIVGAEALAAVLPIAVGGIEYEAEPSDAVIA